MIGCNVILNPFIIVRRDTSVGIATRYALDGPVIESRLRGTRFSAPVQTVSGTHPASYIIGTGSVPGVKRPGRGADHPSSPSCAEVRQRVELYFSHLGFHGML